jgi:hypothetical protein
MEEVNVPMSVFVRNITAWQVDQQEQLKEIKPPEGDPWRQ